MIAKKYLISVAVIGGLMLAGCNTPPSESAPVENTQPEAMESVESTGNAEADVDAIESEVESLEVDSDFPDIEAETFE